MPDSAVFSDDRVYRYSLVRWLVQEHAFFQTVLFVCLNPSTADETKNDPTVRKCIGYARRWGFNRLVVCNLFALRSTDPKTLYSHSEPVGEPESDAHLCARALEADLIVAAWGNHGALRDRGSEVLALLRSYGDVHAFGLNASGQPKHPLYLRNDAVTVPLGESVSAAG